MPVKPQAQMVTKSHSYYWGQYGPVERPLDLESGLESKSRLCHLLPALPWANHFSALGLCLLILIKASTFQ